VAFAEKGAAPAPTVFWLYGMYDTPEF